LQHEFNGQEQMAQPFATMILLMFFDSKTYIHSHSIVTVILFTFLNLSMGIYDRFQMIFDWTIDYKSVALPIELWGRKKFFSWKYQIKQA